MADLPQVKPGAKKNLQSRTQMMARLSLPNSADDSRISQKVEVARVQDYQPKGIILDYRNVATSGPETLATGETMLLTGVNYCGVTTSSLLLKSGTRQGR